MNELEKIIESLKLIGGTAMLNLELDTPQRVLITESLIDLVIKLEGGSNE